MSYELQKDLYFFEWDRRHQLSTAIRLPMTIMLGIGGALFSVFRDISLQMLQRHPYLVCTLVLVILGYIINVALYASVFIGQTYRVVGDPKRLHQTYAGWLEYHRSMVQGISSDIGSDLSNAWHALPPEEKSRYDQSGMTDTTRLATEDFQNSIAESFAEASSENLKTNSGCWERLHMGNVTMMILSPLVIAVTALHHFFP